MLGRLARWLRALGRDVVHDEALDDDALARTARGEGRLLLTRDRRLCAQRGRADRSGDGGADAGSRARELEGEPADREWCRVVRAQKPAAQVRELAGPLDLFGPGWRDRLFTRCMVCNAPLEATAYRDVADALPAEVRGDPRVRSAGFRRCPSCRRVYWEGSHTRRMRRWLEASARTAE